MSFDLVDVEYSHELECFVAIFSDGDTVPLDAESITEARREAERIADHG